jgi:hypothetical protein
MAVTFEDVRRIALSLNKVEEGKSYGTAAFKAGGKLFVRLKEDNESLVVRTTFEEREEMMADDPETYYITDHYLKYPWVLVHLSKVHPDSMRDLLKRACRLASSEPAKRDTADAVPRSYRR